MAAKKLVTPKKLITVVATNGHIGKSDFNYFSLKFFKTFSRYDDIYLCELKVFLTQNFSFGTNTVLG